MNNRNFFVLTILSVIFLFAPHTHAQFFKPKGTLKTQNQNSTTKDVVQAPVKQRKLARNKPKTALTSSKEPGTTQIDLLHSVHQEQQSIRAELETIQQLIETSNEAPQLSIEQERQKSELTAQLDIANDKLAKLEQAIAGGLDIAVVADSKAGLEQHISELTASLEKIVPQSPDAEEDEHQLAVNNRLSKIEAQLGVIIDDTGQSTNTVSSSAQIEPAQDSIGLSLSLSLGTAYVVRGLNFFQSNSQNDQHGVLSPNISYSFGDSGFTVGYQGAYQISGDNRGQKVAVGLGHEQDLFLSYSHAVSKHTSVHGGLVYFLYPFADKEAAGVANPSFLEPRLGISRSGLVDLDFSLAYFGGVQQPLRNLSYLYIRPALSKGFTLSPTLNTTAGLGFGYKVYKSDATIIQDNMFDLSFDWSWSISISEAFSLSPGVHLAWTNLKDKKTVSEDGGQTTIETRHAGDEYVVWFTLTSAMGI